MGRIFNKKFVLKNFSVKNIFKNCVKNISVKIFNLKIQKICVKKL